MTRAIFCAALLACACATPGAAGSCAVRTELYFGLGKPAGGAVSAAEFEGFAHQEIEARFPQGFTVLRADGEWRGGREESRLVVLVHACGEREAEIEALRSSYKTRFAQEAVLRVDTAAAASF